MVMENENKPVRVLYSFPHKLGAERVCYTGWQQVRGLSEAGAEVLVFPGVLSKPLPSNVRVRQTLAIGKARISYNLVGHLRAAILHDYIVSKRIRALAKDIDIIHVWPTAALKTLRTAQELGIPTVLERPNAHTRVAYELVQAECDRLGVRLPSTQEHAFNKEILQREEEEYQLAYRLLCPSDFVAGTFLSQGFTSSKLLRHMYGFDEKVYFPSDRGPEEINGLTVLFAGVCAVRKGLHFALQAWLRSSAHKNGTFLIAGNFVSDYREKLSGLLSHPSIRVLGLRNDIPELMRRCNCLVLPSIEEGSPLVVAEAIGSGCVPLVSDVCTGMCRHMKNGLVHSVGDVERLADHFTMLDNNHEILAELRSGCLRTAPDFTWTAAGRRLLEVYREAIAAFAHNRQTQASTPLLKNATDSQPAPECTSALLPTCTTDT